MVHDPRIAWAGHHNHSSPMQRRRGHGTTSIKFPSLVRSSGLPLSPRLIREWLLSPCSSSIHLLAVHRRSQLILGKFVARTDLRLRSYVTHALTQVQLFLGRRRLLLSNASHLTRINQSGLLLREIDSKKKKEISVSRRNISAETNNFTVWIFLTSCHARRELPVPKL